MSLGMRKFLQMGLAASLAEDVAKLKLSAPVSYRKPAEPKAVSKKKRRNKIQKQSRKNNR